MIDYEVDAEKLICRFEEHMDTENCSNVEKELIGKISETDRFVIFDLEKTDYVASLFLGLCMQAMKKVGSERMKIINARPEIRKVYKIARLDTIIDID